MPYVKVQNTSCSLVVFVRGETGVAFEGSGSESSRALKLAFIVWFWF